MWCFGQPGERERLARVPRDDVVDFDNPPPRSAAVASDRNMPVVDFDNPPTPPRSAAVTSDRSVVLDFDRS
jgi:hypothetical protein